ncbi:MAG: hypothetical protein H7Y86_05765 [Rhizobacter sp.]|nr:hypothetical protein [Ferruginibacter sp.]
MKHTDFKEAIGTPNRVLKCIAEDSNGILWTASENVLQWFDGTNFHEVPYGNGPHEIPGLIFNQVYRSPENEIWIFYNKGFSVYQPYTHSFKHYKDIIPAVESEVFVLVAQTKNELVLRSSKNLYYLDRLSKKIIRYQSNQYVVDNVLPYNVSNNHIIKTDNAGIYIQNLGTAKHTFFKRPEPLLNFSFHYLNNNLALYATDHYISFYDGTTGSLLKTIPYPYHKYLQTYGRPSNIVQKDGRTALVLLDDELWEVDLLKMEFSKKLVTLTGNNFIGNGYFKNALYDSRSNLWVTSNLHGLIKISGRSQAVQLIAPGNEAQHFVKCFVVNKAANLILTGTYGKGLMLYDTLGNFIKNFPLSAHGEASLVTSIGQLDDDRYLVFAHSNPHQYIVNCRTMQLDSIGDKSFRPGYYSELQEVSKGTFFYLASGKKNKVEWKNNRLLFSSFTDAEMQEVYSKGMVKAKLTDLKQLTNDPYFSDCLKKIGLQQIGIQLLAKRNENWLFGTIKGIYEFDAAGKLLQTYNIKSGLTDEYIYAIVLDNNGDIWCSHNKGLSRIDTKGRIFNLNKEDGLQSDEFNYGAGLKTADGQLFFGGINGLNAFYPAQLNSAQDMPRLLITHISSNENILPADTAFWNVKNLKLPFENNQIKINFSAIGNNTGTYYNYQYRVKGLDYEWKDLGHTQEINLALPSGSYVLELAAGNSFNRELPAQKIISIEIVPPYYQRWWFITIAIIMLLTGAALIVQAINKNKYRKKLELIKMQQELETERQRISRDLHDNMGAYTTALLANVEKLRIQKGENDELVKMKNNADNILNSLRETIWVLNNKEISVADFSDALKTYCIKALQNFENINFEAGEIIDDNKIMSAAEAIHFDKILKEAFQNIIKHSGATQIHFTVISNSNLEFSLTDNGKGYDINSRAKGNGLENMRWRARETSAVLTMESVEGKGSIITIKK